MAATVQDSLSPVTAQRRLARRDAGSGILLVQRSVNADSKKSHETAKASIGHNANPKAIDSHLYRMLTKSGEVVRVGRGVYALA